LDLGPYYITNLVQLIGPVKSVSAAATASFSTRRIGNGLREGEMVPVTTPTNIHAILEFASGAIVTLGASWDVSAHRHENMELYGSEGSLYLPDPNFFGGDVLLARSEGKASKLDARNHPFSVNNTQDGQDTPRANYRCAGLAEMASSITEGRAHRCSLELATHVVEVMTGILDAGETRQWVDMTTTCEQPAAIGPDEARALLV